MQVAPFIPDFCTRRLISSIGIHSLFLCAARSIVATEYPDGLWCALSEPDWPDDLASDYAAVVAVNAMHWFSVARPGELFGDIFQSLRSGGAFLPMEPAGAESQFASGFSAWQKEQPSRHKHEDWLRFWSRVNALLGRDYGGYLGEPDQNRIGDKLAVMRWLICSRMPVLGASISC